jgi:chitosanase
MDLSALQKAAAQAIVNIFETGTIRGNYGDVTLMRGDSGQLTYGRSQTTLASGNLYLLISDYAARSDGAYSEQMKPYLAALEASDPALNNNSAFRQLLRDAGDDPVMQDVQDAFFDRVYWDPAMRSAVALGAKTALGAAIVYDSTVHGSWAHVRDMTRKEYGELARIGEEAWMAYYVDERHNWLATHPNPLLHKTVYRMDAFKQIIGAKNWPLALAIPVRGLSITEAALASATTPVKVPAEGTPHRLLRLKSPPLSGPDVSWLQERLARAGIHVEETGVFDQATDLAVRAFQENHNLKADGVVGPVTRGALEDLAVTTPAKSAEHDVPMPAVAPAVPEPVAPSVSVTSDAHPAPDHAVSHPPAHTAPAHPAPTHDTHAAPAPAEPSTDSIADIKQHITDEVQRSIDSITGSMRDQNVQILQKIVSGDAKGAIDAVLKNQNPAVAGTIISYGRPIVAAILSLIALVFTEGRDFLTWTKTTGNAPAAGPAAVPSVAHPVSQISNFDQAMASLRDYGSEAWVLLHNTAATVPNEWVFRLRVGALALITYAVARLFAHHRAQAKVRAG